MSYLEKKEVQTLAAAFVTCGGRGGMLFESAKALLANPEGGEISEVIPEGARKLAQKSLTQLEAEAEEGQITANSILRRYGLPAHFHEMAREAASGCESVAGEISAEVRSIAHTLLPLTNGVYQNEGRIISFKGLVPLGEQKGNLVVHLAGVFACHCSKKEIEALLAEQAKDPEFLRLADKVGTLDYDSTVLQELTLRAKEELGL